MTSRSPSAPRVTVLLFADLPGAQFTLVGHEGALHSDRVWSTATLMVEQSRQDARCPRLWVDRATDRSWYFLALPSTVTEAGTNRVGLVNVFVLSISQWLYKHDIRPAGHAYDVLYADYSNVSTTAAWPNISDWIANTCQTGQQELVLQRLDAVDRLLQETYGSEGPTGRVGGWARRVLHVAARKLRPEDVQSRAIGWSEISDSVRNVELWMHGSAPAARSAPAVASPLAHSPAQAGVAQGTVPASEPEIDFTTPGRPERPRIKDGSDNVPPSAGEPNGER
jgi:hypothetical protein